MLAVGPYLGGTAGAVLLALGSGDRAEGESGIGWEATSFDKSTKFGTKDAERGEIPPDWQCGQINVTMSFETGGFIQKVCHPESQRSHNNISAKACVSLHTSHGQCRSGR